MLLGMLLRAFRVPIRVTDLWKGYVELVPGLGVVQLRWKTKVKAKAGKRTGVL